MKVLLANPACPQTFWSFDRVLRMLGKKILLPPLGLLTVAALLPEEWPLRLVDLMARDVTEDDWDHCDVLFVSGMITQSSGMIEIVKEGRRRAKKVVVGGPLAFHTQEPFFDAGADIVVVGEAELAVPVLLDAIERNVSGIVIQTAGRAVLPESPSPRYDLLEMSDYVDMSVQFSRGCPFMCEFCDITLMFGREVRTKSSEQILHELQTLYDLGWRRAVFFVDDNFVGNPSRAKRLLEDLIPWMEERGHPFDFYTQASVNLSADEQLLDLMVRAGFYRVFLGIETTDRESLKQAKKHQNAAMDLDRVCEKISRAGLQIIAGCILGFDNEQAGADQRLIDFSVRNQIPEMFVTLLQAGPGTDLWKRLRAEGRLLPFNMKDSFGSQTGSINFVPTRPIDEIVGEFLRTYDVLYEPGSYLQRTYNHFSRMNPLPYKKGFSPPYLSEIRAVLIALFRQGVVYSSRWKFWKFLAAAVLKFPSRLPHFFASLVTAEHYFEYRQTIKDRLHEEPDSDPLRTHTDREDFSEVLSSKYERRIAGG